LTGVLVVGAFLSMLDGSIVNVGLDTIARDCRMGCTTSRESPVPT